MQDEILNLKLIANTLRQHVIRMVGEANSGHPGGSLSAADILTVLFFKEMRIDPANPQWQDRDRFVLSKGHASPILYAALAERGFFPKEWLLGFRKINSPLQGHPDMKKVPGVEMSTGSLGQGFSTAVGMALGLKLDRSPARVYALLGDGEIQEGIIWEAAMAAAHYKLNNLTAILDYNGLQIDGPVQEVMNPEPIADKWRSFGFKVITIDGHNISEIINAIDTARQYLEGPSIIIARTIKGKGVSFMENRAEWHGTAPKPEQVEKALAELLEGREKLWEE
ncbi:transketolase [Carboxydothermus pertinax]|uniref:Transketolase n=1 Tax=Carboxydothermus pertinax TaxID=870242 RepID=A0A1L8CV87_9THEO|nr:transketolase [Carboxydothermus pertinax]